MDTLPALGTTYNSMAHFKVDVYAKAASLNEVLSQIGYDNWQVCRLNCPFNPKGSQKECELGIACIKIGDSVVVVHRKTNHSCDLPQLSNKVAEEKKVLMRKKLEDQLAVVAAANDKKKKKKKGAKGREMTPEWKKHSEVNETRGQEEYEELLTQVGDDFRTEKTMKYLAKLDADFPRAFALQGTIDRLKTAVVELPSADDTFSTQEDLLARLYAFSQQRDVLLKPVNNLASTTRKSLMCAFNNFGCDSVGRGRCPVTYTILQSKDEAKTWSLVHPLAAHSHVVSEPLLNSLPEEDTLMLSTAQDLAQNEIGSSSSTLAQSIPQDASRPAYRMTFNSESTSRRASLNESVASASTTRSPFFTRPTDGFASVSARSDSSHSKRQLELDYLTPSPPSSKTRRLSSNAHDSSAARSGSH